MDNSKLWGGRFSAEPDKLVEQLTESISFDVRLYKVDILGSQAHAKGLAKAGILTAEELARTLKALDELLEEIEAGAVGFRADLEDVHMNIEYLLTQKIGDLGKKIHTGRSRNDQVATDLRLYLKEAVASLTEQCTAMQRVLLDLAGTNIDVILPGFTHLQIAQPVLFAHHMLAYFEMIERDKQRLSDCYIRMDLSPLGSAALAGSTYGQDREYVAGEMGFGGITANSMDAVSDRDFVLEFLSAASIMMMHLSRFAEELVLWLAPQFNYVTIDDAFTTGSSIMPQKRNPDVAELTRGKTGRVYGNLMSMLSIMKGLPLTYNRDLQEDKEPVFDTVDTLSLVLPAFTAMIRTLKVNKERLYSQAREGFSGATDLADYLTKQGIPFRESHRIVGNIVKHCEEQGKYLDELSKQELLEFIPSQVQLPDDLAGLLSPRAAILAREIAGGTGTQQVLSAIERAEALLESSSSSTW